MLREVLNYLINVFVLRADMLFGIKIYTGEKKKAQIKGKTRGLPQIAHILVIVEWFIQLDFKYFG